MEISITDKISINGIGVYFWILENINNKLIELIKFNENKPEIIGDLFFYLAIELNRIIQYKYDKVKNDYVLETKGGILKLKKSFRFLVKDYIELFKKYKSDLITVKKIRNKFQHEPHNIRWKAYVGNNKSKDITFANEEYYIKQVNGVLSKNEQRKIEEGRIELEWDINTEQLINLIVELNEIFIKIQKQINNKSKEIKDMNDHPYIRRMIDMNLQEYITILIDIKNNPYN